ncbi:MAG TPA: tRNA (guanosine(37)-N1)-methyltransferase TrmD [bacterium]|nr:tRNA (guanosine(37)-N1)-methyltransferase TrmD [bacterium]
MPLQFDILTLFPSLFDSPFSHSILKRAQEAGLISIRLRDIRDFTEDKHRRTDDIPYGGGPGMVMKPGPAVAAIEAAAVPGKKVRRIYFSPQGRPLNQEHLAAYLEYDQLVLLCGRYEGVDERVIEHFIDEEVSIGDYILTGGEFAAMVFVDAVSRLIPGVLGEEGSLKNESFSASLLEYPQYTRPPEFRGHKVPEVLLSGDHAKIEAWRREMALERTRKKRPDLLKK